MATKHLLEGYVQRFPHKNDFYGVLEWERLGRLKMLAPKCVREGNGYDDLGLFIYNVFIDAEAARKWSAQDIKSALYTIFAAPPCHHSYDCCGCRVNYNYIRKVGRRRYVVRMDAGRNY